MLLLKEKQHKVAFSFNVDMGRLQLVYMGKKLNGNVLDIFTKEKGIREMIDYDLNSQSQYVIRITKIHYLTASKLTQCLYVHGLCNYEILEKE